MHYIFPYSEWTRLCTQNMKHKNRSMRSETHLFPASFMTPFLCVTIHILHPLHTLTAVSTTTQVSTHETITIYIAHTIHYKADPLFTRCCCHPCRDNGIPFEHLTPCLWPRHLFTTRWYFRVPGPRLTLHHVERISAVVYGGSTHAHASNTPQSIWIPNLTVTMSEGCVI